MAKINRFDGNVKAIAADSLTGERYVFGSDVTVSDELTDQYNASMLRGWGIIGASDLPPLEWFNAQAFTATQFISYLHQMGIPEWNALQEFPENAIANKNGSLYVSKQIHIGQDPALDSTNTYWKNPINVSVFFSDTGSASAYVLSVADNRSPPNSYENGYEISFVALNNNTGACTVNVSGLGVKSIKTKEGSDPALLQISGRTNLAYDLGNDWFELLEGSGGGGATGGGPDQVFFENGATVTTDYTLSLNSMSVGPIAIDDGITVTVPAGKRWVIL
jgi:hypothetical protein